VDSYDARRRRLQMRPETHLDWIAFTFLILGAFSWGYYFVTDVNILDLLFERIWDPLDDVVFVLIATSGAYWLVRAFTARRTPGP
jgi:uncharacterized membrane protein YuzA (DUF378 family)